MNTDNFVKFHQSNRKLLAIQMCQLLLRHPVHYIAQKGHKEKPARVETSQTIENATNFEISDRMKEAESCPVKKGNKKNEKTNG